MASFPGRMGHLHLGYISPGGFSRSGAPLFGLDTQLESTIGVLMGSHSVLPWIRTLWDLAPKAKPFVAWEAGKFLGIQRLNCWKFLH